MSSAAKETRKALLSVLKAGFTEAGLKDVDVLDWYSSEYAKAIAVVIGRARSDISRDRFAVPNSIPFGETWFFDIDIITTGGYTSNTEISDLIYDVGDVVIGVLGSKTRLDGTVTGLVKSFVEAFDLDINKETGRPEGTVLVNCRYRINRREY